MNMNKEGENMREWRANKNGEIKLNLDMQKIAEGITIRSYFDLGYYGLLKYNKKTNELLVNKEMLMTLIKMINPAQVDREIKLLTENDWLNRNE